MEIGQYDVEFIP
jgi:hypothetical protein